MTEAVKRHAAAGGQFLEPVSADEMWERLEWFLRELVPTAEEAGVRLAAHPNDPPLPVHRGIGQTLSSPVRVLVTFPECLTRKCRM